MQPTVRCADRTFRRQPRHIATGDAGAGGGVARRPGDEARSDRAPPKKTKKKKVPKERHPAPDEDVDPDAVEIVDGERGWRFTWKQHPSIRYGDAFRLDGEGKIQVDGRHASYVTAPRLDPWELHRSRFGIKGNLFKRIEYEVEREFTERELTEKDIALGVTPRSKWKDVNVNLTYVKNAQVQIGKFKIPFGLDELTGVTQNDYIYRSLSANYLAPARDIGAVVHGRFFRRGLSYWAGAFKHDGDNARSRKIQGGDATFAARLTSAPFRRLASSPLGAMELGTAYTESALSDDSFRPNGLRGRTIVTQDTFNEPVYVKGRRRRWEADVDWTRGPASARAEFTLVRDRRDGQGIADNDLPDARARAWYVSGTWVLTGEDKRRPIKAAAPLLQGGIGAVELAVRYERIWFDSVGRLEPPFRNSRAETIFPEGEKALTLGVNWTLNRFSKILVNAIREQVEDRERNPVPNGAAIWSGVVRFQFVL
jgi:phosphate-selective porin OprO and OprP